MYCSDRGRQRRAAQRTVVEVHQRPAHESVGLVPVQRPEVHFSVAVENAPLICSTVRNRSVCSVSIILRMIARTERSRLT